MNSVAEIIDSFGGPSAFARATGLKDSHVRTMKTRDSIPDEYRAAVVAAAKQANIPGITYESLTLMHVKSNDPQKPQPERVTS